ncbi:MAG: Na/Pi symporter [Candidatus Cyclobacteriaceae bacterium M2_1C_046]
MWRKNIFRRVIKIFLALILFLFSIDLMGEAFKSLGLNVAESLIFATSNPYISLLIGLLITAIIQSSSTSTSMIVALVASNAITIPEAIPMIMGANIGTTLTSTIVSVGFITQRNEFRKALSAAVAHDFFNVLTVVILLPLEIYYGVISTAAIAITGFFVPAGYIFSGELFLFSNIFPSQWIVEIIDINFLILVISFISLFLAIKFLADNLSKLLIGESKDKLKAYVFNNPFKSFTWGTILTASVQSSSITTSLIVPLVATGKVNLKNSIPFIMGANIGTTITAFIAALFISNAALSIAIAHLLFNLVGVLIFLPFPFFRNLLKVLAAAFGKLVIRYRLAGLGYVMLLFFIVPFTLIYLNRDMHVELNKLTYERTDYVVQDTSYFNIIYKNIDNKRFDRWYSYPDNIDFEQDKSEVYNVFKRKNMLSINDEYYFINNEGYCWKAENTRVNKKVCIKEIYFEFKFNDMLIFDSVYLFQKSILNLKTGDSVKINEYIDVNDKLLLVKHKFNKEGEIVSQEQLIKTKEL